MAIQLKSSTRLAEFAANGSTRKPDVVVHPLDPLSAAELEDAVGILEREKHLGGDVRIASINLTEPAKAWLSNISRGVRSNGRRWLFCWIAANALPTK